MTETSAAVTGIGLVTPAGIGVTAAWDGLLTGRSRAATDAALAGLPVDFCCRVPDFDADAILGRRLSWRLDRGTQLAVTAAREAVADSGWDPARWNAERVAVVIGVGSVSYDHYEKEVGHIKVGAFEKVSPLAITRSVPNMAAGEIGMDLGARGPNFGVSTACASGATAIGVALGLLRAGSCDIAIAGGAESACNRICSAAFGQMGALSGRTRDPAGASRPFDQDRDGFVLGEGAGVLVLERPRDALGRGARPRAYLAGYGASCDAYRFAAPHPAGRGAAEAMQAALRDAALAPEDIDHINAHGTSTPLNDLAEFHALHHVFGRPPAVSANKSLLGHAIGGAGAIESVHTVLTLERQTIPPTANLDSPDPQIDLDIVSKEPRETPMDAALTNSFGFGGQNAALVFHVA
ncbi:MULTISPECIES: beta-ketoacyl-[acyl-carrier-protein] synthase family protein [Streptomyces]|uniref:Beta-ketoacyl-[acyl-carrier-protein] synthase family protein n=1 Tax=Streptomyces tsukubensis (strain DSM 42081 / NBRC 108919 / NRRL 18488 / 9993) TaxID=1114943 RepID=I2N3A3_STRT9|nr:beta-ketoacyl-[acyl-carrier-protein] synthase family protein [Streptomyces tsukubensis]MYS68469.1 beta-ketoacyl-ACP synthase II [Streptomyces sp. SID5473]AZK95580.1 3-oxoacyl-ACP synthase [Streptomyces tsukubensis]EIF91500.1 3-oxoacyl-ACP synthase [Streptomyces tsukubensis NRRL18488]QKM68384.1 beta-ketoacyl-[acyl-carrier-protein] synthase family protein [Streptomyces tsukubensis NRRL18488]TAI43201.1 beta-ketoacyl-[acyl-carrier-protein] synthase family protein [Streptomyces tsukubensis]